MKDKKLKQQAMAKAEASAHTSVFDLTRVKPEHFAAPLAQLFHSVEWHDVMVRRNKLMKGYLLPGDKAALKKQHLAADRKIADMLLDALVAYHDKVVNRSTRNITLFEYASEFVKTPEQVKLYNDFRSKLDIATALFDIAEGQLTDAKEILHTLDPTTLLTEFDSIKATLAALKNQSSLRFRGEHPELSDLYTDYMSDLEIVVMKHTHEFVQNFYILHKRLIAEGKVKPNSLKEVKQMY